MVFRDYILIKKSTLLAAAALAAGGCLLWKRYAQPGNSLRQDVESLRDSAEDAVNKGKRKVKEAVESD